MQILVLISSPVKNWIIQSIRPNIRLICFALDQLKLFPLKKSCLRLQKFELIPEEEKGLRLGYKRISNLLLSVTCHPCSQFRWSSTGRNSFKEVSEFDESGQLFGFILRLMMSLLRAFLLRRTSWYSDC